jgi:hypothetical protein
MLYSRKIVDNEVIYLLKLYFLQLFRYCSGLHHATVDLTFTLYSKSILTGCGSFVCQGEADFYFLKDWKGSLRGSRGKCLPSKHEAFEFKPQCLKLKKTRAVECLSAVWQMGTSEFKAQCFTFPPRKRTGVLMNQFA